MKKFTIILFSFYILGFGTSILAQNAFPASGGNASGSGGSVSYTAGQTVYTTTTGTNGSVAQGVQQPYEISVVTGIEEAKDISLEIVVYPNPAIDWIKLKIENYKVDNLTYELYDVNGIIVQNNKVVGNETSISMSNLVPATYFLKIIQGNKEIKTFKIIKN